MRLEADDGRPETSPPLRRGVQTADRAVVRERQAIPEDPPSWPDILRTIELGYSNARLEASDNRIKVTIRMAYGFHHAIPQHHRLTTKTSLKHHKSSYRPAIRRKCKNKNPWNRTDSKGFVVSVELAGFEPATLCLQSRCATSCAIAP